MNPLFLCFLLAPLDHYNFSPFILIVLGAFVSLLARPSVLRDYFVFYGAPILFLGLHLLWPYIETSAHKFDVIVAILSVCALARMTITPCAHCQAVRVSLDSIPPLNASFIYLSIRYQYR